MSILALRLMNVYGEAIVHPTVVRILNRVSGSTRLARLPGGVASVTELPGGLSQVSATPLSHHETSGFVMMPSDGIANLEMVCAIDADKVARITRPAAMPEHLASLAYDAGIAPWEQLDDLRAATLMNIAAKCQATTFSNGRNVWSYVKQVLELRQDRCFVIVPHELREETKNSIGAGLFREVSGALHHPPVGYSHAGSFKTAEQYGNLQLTFFSDEVSWVADIDIDDAAGLEHVFHVIEHKIARKHTHPFDIHQTLLQHQGLDTGYRLEVA